MNAPFERPKESSEQKRLKREFAQSSADKWRGSCIRYFADLEQGLVETFDALAESRADDSITDPGFIAQRLRRLIKIADDAPSEHGGKKLARHLAELQTQLHLRVQLTHGTGRVQLDPSGKWRITLRHRRHNGESFQAIICQDEAEKSQALLSVEVPKAVQRMGAFARALRASSRSSDLAGTPSA